MAAELPTLGKMMASGLHAWMAQMLSSLAALLRVRSGVDDWLRRRASMATPGKVLLKNIPLLVITTAFLFLPPPSSSQVGANLSLPFARRSLITQGYQDPQHRAIDYRAAIGTPVVAARSGSVTRADNVCPCDDCCHNPTDPGYNSGYGNLVEIDHGNGYITRYAHLSPNGFAVRQGQAVHRGQRIANADNTGHSQGSHLHFELLHDGIPVNPYDGAWVSGSPIPMGYRDQEGTVHGPFALDYSSIQNKWLELEGEPGSPLGDDYSPWYTAYERLQKFERGYINFVSGSGTNYYAYAKTFLPGIRIGYNGWNSTIIVRNNSNANPASVNITFYHQDGSVADSRTHTSVPAQGIWAFDTAVLPADPTNPIADFLGSAVIAASENVAVAVVERAPQQVAAYAGLLPSGQGDPNWETLGTDLYLPHVYRHDAWGYTSQLTIFNPGPASTSVYITYRDPDGSPRHATGAIPINPLASHVTSPPANLGNAFYGSARVWSNSQPVAVIADALHHNGNADFNYTALNGAITLYLPYLMKQYYGWNSCFTIRNLSENASNTTVVTYYWSGGSRTTSYSVAPNGLLTLCQQNDSQLPNGTLSARVRSQSGIPIAVAVNQSHNGNGWHMSYSSFSQPSKQVILPYLLKNGTDGGRVWRSGFQVQNVGDQATVPTVTYYDSAGQVVLVTTLGSVAAKRSVGVYLPSVNGLPEGFVGSAVVTADQPLVAVVNATCSNCVGDAVYTYNGTNR
ncbi:MAG: hypothetical protein D6759_07490 [Chloroflexi bacterium]|nr:MAG: hypothetical protein D6759_07490 [Chloroflexota bacterium]